MFCSVNFLSRKELSLGVHSFEEKEVRFLSWEYFTYSAWDGANLFGAWMLYIVYTFLGMSDNSSLRIREKETRETGQKNLLHSLSVSRDFSSTKWTSLTVRGVSSVGGISNEEECAPQSIFEMQYPIESSLFFTFCFFLFYSYLVHYKRNSTSWCQLIGRKNPYSSVPYLWIVGYDACYAVLLL